MAADAEQPENGFRFCHPNFRFSALKGAGKQREKEKNAIFVRSSVNLFNKKYDDKRYGYINYRLLLLIP
jgi:hypothetical protein